MPILVLAVAVLHGEEYLRVDSPADGRSYTIDTDTVAVRRTLRPVAAATAASKLPAWLYPSPDARPSDVRYDPGSGITQANFLFTSPESDVIAFYTEVLRGHRLRTSTNYIPGNQGVYLSGSSDSIA